MKINVQWNEQLVTEKTHWKLMNLINRNTMEHHRYQTIPKHFENEAMRLYTGVYAKRSKRYQMMKAKRYHTQAPLVKTGHMREVVIQTGRVTATQYGARYYAKNYYPMTPQRRREVEYVSPVEERAMAVRIETAYAKACNDPHYQRKRRQKIKRG